MPRIGVKTLHLTIRFKYLKLWTFDISFPFRILFFLSMNTRRLFRYFSCLFQDIFRNIPILLIASCESFPFPFKIDLFFIKYSLILIN